jgi:hypothetical protein
MKFKSLHIKKRYLLLLLIVASIIQVACKKENGAAPIISHVRAVDSTKRDSFFVKAYPGTLIVIQGSNFDGLQHVYFNDQDAYFNPALNSSTNIIIGIPTDAPTAPPLSSVPNTIKVVTNHGTAIYSFTLILPPPAIISASNENAIPGTTLTLTGTNFYGITKVVFPGGISGTNLNIISPTQLTVTVPAGITTADSLRIYGGFGIGASPFIFDNYLAPTTGFIANFDGATGTWTPPSDPYYGWSQNQWVGNLISDPTKFPGGTGPTNGTSYCVEINPQGIKPPGDDSWWADANCIITNTATWVSNIGSPVANYALKFEVYVKSTWTQGSIWVGTTWPNWKYMAEYAPWKPSNGGNGKYSTNGWVTVTIPLTKFLTATGNVYTATGTGPSSFTDLQQGQGGMLMIMYANDGTTTIPGSTFDIALDNVRVVKIK